MDGFKPNSIPLVRAKLIGVVVLAAIALVLWRFMSEPVKVPHVEPGGTESRLQPAGDGTNSSMAKPAEAGTPYALNERTLVGTKWEREGFALEFGADGKLLIGGRERARWRVEGSRIRLYRDATPAGREAEEHWLDIVGDKLMWEGREIGRVP